MIWLNGLPGLVSFFHDELSRLETLTSPEVQLDEVLIHTGHFCIYMMLLFMDHKASQSQLLGHTMYLVMSEPKILAITNTSNHNFSLILGQICVPLSSYSWGHLPVVTWVVACALSTTSFEGRPSMQYKLEKCHEPSMYAKKCRKINFRLLQYSHRSALWGLQTMAVSSSGRLSTCSLIVAC